MKNIFMEAPLISDNSKESSFMQQNSATQRHSLVESQFYCHVNTSTGAFIVRRSGTSYVTFLACCCSFRHTHFIYKFQQRRSVFNGL